MSAIHEESQRKALDRFHAASKFGSENERKRFREHLVQNCKKKMETMFEWTEIEKKTAYNASLEMLHGLRSTYRRAMEKDMGGSAEEKRKLLVLHEVHKGESLKTYQSEAAVRAAYFKDHEESLDKDLSRLFGKLQVVNDERETLEVLGSQKGLQENYEAHMFTHSISQQYRDEFEKYSAVYMEHQHIEKQIESLHESYLKLFEDNWNSSWPPIEEYRVIFMATLEEEYRDAIEMNARNKILFDSKLEEYHNRMKVEYRNIMGQVIKETYVEHTQLEEMHDQTQQKLLTEQKKIVSGFAEGIQEDCLEDARRALCSLFEEFKKLNESNKPFKKLLDAKTLLTIFNKAIECVKVLAPIIMQVMAVVKSAKSAYSAIAPAVSSLEFVVPSAATCAVGAGVVIGVVALSFAAYYVYSTHKQADE